MSAGVFDVRYLVATREGLDEGGCGKSILQHVYEGDRIVASRREGFEPRFVVTREDSTHRIFHRSADQVYPELSEVAGYLDEERRYRPHHLNQLW